MDPRTILFSLGYAAYGPIILQMLLWLAERAQKRGVDRLFFLAREGYMLKHFYDRFADLPQIRARFGTLPPSTYLLTSRRACIGAIAKNPSDPEFVEIALTPSFKGTLSDLLDRRIGITPSDFARLGLVDRPVVLPEDVSVVAVALRRARALCAERTGVERDAYLAYLSAAGLMASSHAGLVDLGFSGTIQRCLHTITGKTMSGFYFATTEVAARWSCERNAAFSCFGTIDRSDGTRPFPVYGDSLLLEAWLTSPDGQLIRFEQGQTGSVPLFAAAGSAQRHLPMLMAIRDGSEQYIRQTLELCGSSIESLGIDAHSTQQVFRHLLAYDMVPQQVHQYLVVEDQFCGNAELSVFELYRARDAVA
ncbi:MAG: hypothetical protein IT381_00550 [Deltaproteobacteria bacterium]|nr:hypothetical protein [Deltaproteobacteria bacterium]